MKYFEDNQNFKDNDIVSIFDFVKFILVSLFLSPLRLLNEISSKILFTGEYLGTFLKNCIFINLGMLTLLVCSSFLTNRIYFAGSLLPLPAVCASFVILVVLYYLYSSFHIGVELSENPNKVEEPNIEIQDVEESIAENLENEILTEDNIEETFDKIVEETVPIISPEVNDKLNELLNTFKNNVEDFTPTSNITELYVSEKDLEKECMDMVKKNENLVADMSKKELYEKLANAKPFPTMAPIDDESELIEDAIFENVLNYKDSPWSTNLGPDSGAPVNEDIIKKLLAEAQERKENEDSYNAEDLFLNFDNDVEEFDDSDYL